MPVYETGLLSRRDGAIRVILPSPEAQAPKLAGRAPAQARKTTEVIEHMLPAPQRVSRLRSWLYHECPPPVTPEPVFRTASYADASRGATYHVMSQVVRGSSLRAVPASESDGTSDPQRAVAQGGGRGGRSSLPALSRDAAPRARRQPRQRSKLYGERTDELREEVKWKLHAGCDPLMSTEEILALGKLDESEEQLVQSVMAQQAGEETFCTWMLNRPLLEHVLGKTTHLLQNSLDSLAEATVFAVERRGKQLQVRSRSDWSGDFSLPERFLANCAVLCGACADVQMSKHEWMQFARKKANVSSREFNTIWKAYRIYRDDGSSQQKTAKHIVNTDVHRPWHVTAATTYGKPLVTCLADQKAFRRREIKLSTAQQHVDQSKSVWADPIKPPSVSWFSRQTADFPIGGDGRR